MDKFTTLEGVAAPLKIINVDTDMIIPKQYLKTIKRTGLGKGLFSEQRYKDDGSENPDFILNKPAYRNAKVLVAGDNFGCGSSREHAPWALLDFGIRCVISTSFGDIFYNNCFKNGILPIRVSQDDLDKLFDDAERGANATLTIDLANQEIRGPDGGTVKFEIDPFRKHCLLNGLDDIGLTMEKKSSIDSYEAKAKTRARLGLISPAQPRSDLANAAPLRRRAMRPDVVTFWHGPLDALRQTCLRSQVAAGHKVTVYSFDPLAGPARRRRQCRGRGDPAACLFRTAAPAAAGRQLARLDHPAIQRFLPDAADGASRPACGSTPTCCC